MKTLFALAAVAALAGSPALAQQAAPAQPAAPAQGHHQHHGPAAAAQGGHQHHGAAGAAAHGQGHAGHSQAEMHAHCQAMMGAKMDGKAPHEHSKDKSGISAAPKKPLSEAEMKKMHDKCMAEMKAK